MKTRKRCKGILKQGLIVVSLVMLFFTISTAGFGIEKIQAEKAFSEYSKKPRYIYISNDFKKLLIIDKDLDKDEEDVSYWDIDGKEDPILIWEKRKKFELRAERAYSPDLRYYAEPKGDTIYIKKMEDDLLVNKIVLPINTGYLRCEIKISNDNSKLVVLNTEYPEGKTKNYMRLYDIKSGKLIDDIDLNQHDYEIYGFSFDDKYISFAYGISSKVYTRIYSIEQKETTFLDVMDLSFEIKYGYSFIKEDMIYILNHREDSGNKFIDIIDVSKGLYGEVIKTYNNIEGNPRMVPDFLGRTYDGTTFNELIAVGDKLEKYKTHQIEDEEIKKIAYNKEKEEWVIVGQNRVHYIPTAAGVARDSFEQYAEALELLEIGFTEGIDRVKETLAKVPSTALAQNNGRFLNLDYDLSLKERAELVLAEYNCLMAGESRSIIGIDCEFIKSPVGYKITSIGSYSDLNRYPEIKEGAVIIGVNGKAIFSDRGLTDYYSSLKPGESITLTINQDGMNQDYEIKLAGDMLDNYALLYAHRKLFEYGLLAVRAGYPQFTLQAADQIRGLKLMYPSDLLWDKIGNHIILMEAVGIAVRDGSEAGFKHMLDNDGILNADDNKNYILNVYLNSYPEYFAPLLADKKKMSYFTKIAENELPSVQMWEIEKVDFVDLEGNEIAGVESHMGDSSADGAAGENSIGESDDSGDDKSSESVGTVLD